MVENRSLEEEMMEDNITSVLRMPDYVMRSKFVLEGVLLPIMAAFGFLGELGVGVFYWPYLNPRKVGK